MFDATLLQTLTSNAVANWTTTAIVFILAIRSWPAIKAKINEARKIELGADGEFRSDLIARIHKLEEDQHRDKLEFADAMREERKRCDKELDEIRSRLTIAENENKGLQSMIRQHSQSGAMLMGSPDALAMTKAARKKRGEE
jgi:hypothetical protein